MSESSVTLGQIVLKAAKLGYRFWRNQVGTYKIAKCGCESNTMYITSGLGPGSHDLIGFKPVVITADMIGNTIAQFVSCEVKLDLSKAGKGNKEERKRFQQQTDWRDMINRCGGISFFADNNTEIPS